MSADAGSEQSRQWTGGETVVWTVGLLFRASVVWLVSQSGAFEVLGLERLGLGSAFGLTLAARMLFGDAPLSSHSRVSGMVEALRRRDTAKPDLGSKGEIRFWIPANGRERRR